MAVLSKEDFMKRVQERIGEDNSDEALSFVEDMSDTYNDMETRTNGVNEEEWQKKLDDLDASWRDKYKARFFEGQTTPEKAKEEQEEDVQDDGENVTFEDLFEEREG